MTVLFDEFSHSSRISGAHVGGLLVESHALGIVGWRREKKKTPST